jgi:HlyD family secretion protein
MALKARLLFTIIILTLLGVTGCSRSENQAQGYIEGRYTYMATPVSGVLKELKVSRGTQVKKGQILFILEEEPESDIYSAAIENLNQSKSARDAISANLSYAKLTFERYRELFPKKAVSQSQLDNARAIFNALTAQLAQANATIASTAETLAQTKWMKDQKVVSAPYDAMVFDTYYRLGEYTIANQAVLSLLAPSNIKVIFYVSEWVLGSLKLGDQVTVECNSCSQTYTGHISFISPSAEYTPPVIYSNETTEKLIYRIEAEFSPQAAQALHPGQPVIVSYNVHGR